MATTSATITSAFNVTPGSALSQLTYPSLSETVNTGLLDVAVKAQNTTLTDTIRAFAYLSAAKAYDVSQSETVNVTPSQSAVTEGSAPPGKM